MYWICECEICISPRVLALPDILTFQDPRAFLKAALAVKKAHQHGFGLRQIAAKAGFRSPATLSMMLSNQRRLSTEAAEKLGKILGLSARRRAYLIALVQLESAKTPDEKLEIQEKLLQLKSQQEENFLTLQQYRCLAIWYYPAIYALVGTRSFQRSPEWIAKKLGRGVSPSEVRQALGDLLNLGLIEEKNGKLQQTNGALTTAEELKMMAVRRYHQQMLSLAAQSLDVPLEQRELNGLTIPIPHRKLNEVKDRIRAFRKEMHQFLSQFDEDGEVYQLNLQLFPLTQSTGEKA